VPDQQEALHEYGITLQSWDSLPKSEAIVVAVSHQEFVAKPLADYQTKFANKGVLVDVKAIFDPKAVAAAGIALWRL